MPKKKKFYKRWWFWVIVVVVIAAIGGAGSDDSGKVADTPETTVVTQVAENTTTSATRSTTKTTEESTTNVQQFISSCKQLDYKAVSRNPDQYKGDPVYIKGKVVQVSESSMLFSDDTRLILRVNTKEGEYGIWEDTVYITYTLKAGESRILEDDNVTIYGTCKGIETYTAVLGNSISIPSISAVSIEIN